MGALYITVRATTPTRLFDRSEWRRFAALVVWLAVAPLTQLVGTDLTNASQDSLLTVLTPAFMPILGVTALGEHSMRRKLLGTALATVETLVVLSGQHDAVVLVDGSISGAALLLFPPLYFAAFSVFAKSLIRRYSAFEIAAYAAVLSVPLFGVLVPVEFYLNPAVFSSISPSLSAVGAVFYLSLLSTVAAWYCWHKGMEYANVSVVDVFFFARPVVDILPGAVFLRKPVGLESLGGGAVLIIRVLLVNMD